MAFSSTLRINMTGRCEDPGEESERYRAAIEMAVYAEEHGFGTVNFEEHHCAANGWLSSPLTLAAMVIARTERIRVNVAALLVTLYDPVRLAEDIAVLDLVSQGRFSFVAGIGYRPLEYHATGKDWDQRGRLMDECVETLLKAWTGEPFEYRGKTIRVTPVPMTRPTPFFFLGGMSRVSARRDRRPGTRGLLPRGARAPRPVGVVSVARARQRDDRRRPGPRDSLGGVGSLLPPRALGVQLLAAAGSPSAGRGAGRDDRGPEGSAAFRDPHSGGLPRARGVG